MGTINYLAYEKLMKFSQAAGKNQKGYLDMESITNEDLELLRLYQKFSYKSINSLLNSICNQSDWKRSDYNLASHNCQEFVCKFIEK